MESLRVSTSGAPAARKTPLAVAPLVLCAISANSVVALESIFPVTIAPPAGWALDARNGISAPDLGSTGPDVISADGASRLRIRVGTIYSSPYTTSATITPGDATNLEYKYDLSGFSGNEIALGARFRVVNYAGLEPGGDGVMSLSLP